MSETWEQVHRRLVMEFRTDPDKPLRLLRARHDLYALEGRVASLGAGQWVALLALSVPILALLLGTDGFSVIALIATGVVAAGAAAGLLVSVHDSTSKMARQRLLVEAYQQLLP